jgi:photosystem II stability/assembly factor-like uncharacterized protein
MRAAGAAALSLAAAAALAQGRPEAVVTTLTLFAGTSSGLYWSRNWGADWERRDEGATQAILPLGPRVLAGGSNGLIVSEDFGQKWQRIEAGASVLAVLISRYPQSDPTMFVGTPAGLLKSEDNGRTFKPTPLKDTPVHRLEWPGPALVIATGRGVAISTDGAATFLPAPTGLPEASVRALALSSYFVMDPVMFAGVAGGGVFRSSDGGKTFTPSGLAEAGVNDLVWLGPLLYAATDQGIFRSQDAGATWQPLGKGLEGRAALRLMFPLAPAAGLEAFVGTDRGVFHTMDGGETWRPSGLGEERVLALATFPPPEPPPATRRKR